MKKCPACESINSDNDQSCGVCGANLSGAVSENPDQLIREKELTPRLKGRRNYRSIAVLTLGLVTIGTGVYALAFGSPLGLLLLVLGVFITVSILGVGPGIGGKGIINRGYDTVAEEEQEERGRESGEAD